MLTAEETDSKRLENCHAFESNLDYEVRGLLKQFIVNSFIGLLYG